MLRMISIALAPALLLASAGAGQAQSVRDVLAQAGLLGLWANDCGRPAGDGNFHTTYTVEATGQVALRYDSGPGYQPLTYTVTGARIAGPGRIVYQHLNRASGVQITVTLVYTQTSIRVWHSQRSTGEILVADGRFTSSGAESPLQWRCS